MKANELRIGNWVNFNHNGVDWGDVKINSNFFKHYEQEEYENKPIPLTEEWLLKFGFEKAKEGDYTMGVYTVFIREYISISNYHGYIADIKHVHQLQNLYFALTNTELEIK